MTTPHDELEARRRRRVPGKPARSGMAALSEAADALAGAAGEDEGEQEERQGSRASHPSATRDPQGTLHLFSGTSPGALGTLVVDCSSCRAETPVSLPTLVGNAFPFSLHLPLVKRYHSLMRCPACGRRAWVRVHWRG